MKYFIIPLVLSCHALAGTPVVESVAMDPPEEPHTWWYNITPYVWIVATDGDMGVAGLTAPVDISMKDSLEDLEFSFMLAIEGGIDRWVFGFDGIYGAFSDGGNLPAAAAPFTYVTVDFDQFLCRVHAGYQVIAEDNAELTAFVGARYSYISTDIAFTGAAPEFSEDRGKSWIDPVIGLRGVWKINHRWFLQGGGDIGGFGVSSDLIWQANIAIGYHYNDKISLLAGYRGLGVDYTDGGFLMDTVAHGPVIGMTFRF
jgi:hypothetical protein